MRFREKIITAGRLMECAKSSWPLTPQAYEEAVRMEAEGLLVSTDKGWTFA